MKKKLALDPTMPQRSYSYGRISTSGRQARGDGLRRQQGALDETDDSWPEAVSKEQGWALDDTLRFTDKGRSGFHKKNLTPTGALRKFLNCIKDRTITPGSVLLIDKLDRLTRAEVDEAYDLFRDIIRAGVWVCTRVPFRIYRPDAEYSFMDMLEPLWIMYVNWMESVKKQDNSLAAWEAARYKARKEKAAIAGKPPFWLRKKPDLSGYDVVTEMKALALRLHEMAQNDLGSRTIARRLIEEGTPSPGTSGRWSEPFVQSVLKSRSCFGEYQPMRRGEDGKRRPIGAPIPDFYPAIMTEYEWSRTQAAINSRRGNRGRRGPAPLNLFAGLAWDAELRRKMCKHYGGGSRGRTTYASLAAPCTRGGNVPYPAFEKCLLDALMLLRPADVLDRPAEANEREARIAAMTARMVGLDNRKQQLTKAAADPDQDVGVILPALRAVAAELESVAKELETLKLESRTSRAEALAQCQTLRELRDSLAGQERDDIDHRIRAALPWVVGEIWVQSQRVSDRHRVVHVQIWLRNGKLRYVQIVPPNLHGEKVWQLEEWDLRRGAYTPGRDVCDVAAIAQLS